MMDARPDIKARLSSPHVTEGSVLPYWADTLAPSEIGDRFSMAAGEQIKLNLRPRDNLFDVAEVFKRPPCVPDLKPGGRHVAKDLFEVGGIPLLMKTLLDHDCLHGECTAVTSRTIAEKMKSVTSNPDQAETQCHADA